MCDIAIGELPTGNHQRAVAGTGSAIGGPGLDFLFFDVMHSDGEIELGDIAKRIWSGASQFQQFIFGEKCGGNIYHGRREFPTVNSYRVGAKTGEIRKKVRYGFICRVMTCDFSSWSVANDGDQIAVC